MAVEPIPVLQRQTQAEGPNIRVPDFQSATQDLAASQNNLSAIGAQVAQTASNQIATQLGFEKGKNPTGNTMPAITDFDKHFNESYEQQSQATLSLKGQQLLDNTHNAMAQASILTPDLIAKTTQQLQLGLSQIAEQAPSGVKEDLQKQFDSNIENLTSQYTEKMNTQQREDQKNTLLDGIDISIKNALEFGKDGNSGAANAAVRNAKDMADNALSNRFTTPEEARIAKETADQAMLNGLYINMAIGALKSNQYDKFESNYAKNKPEGMTNEQWIATGEAFKKQISFIQGLQEQDQNLKAQQMNNRIAADPSSITGTEWQQFVSTVSPLKSEEIKFRYIQALKKQQSSNQNVDMLVNNFSNPQVWANTSTQTQNAAFNKSVQYAQQQAKSNGSALSTDDAQVQVAASAGGEVKVFTNQLKNELHSGNPQFIQAAAIKIHLLRSMGAGHALIGLNDEDKSLYTAYESLNTSRDPVTAARDATQTVINQDWDVQKANKEKFALIMSSSANGGKPPAQAALKKFGMSESSFISPNMANVYGSDILRKYSTFYELLNGDDNSAQKLTQEYVDDNYGDTKINGGNYKTLHPIEKTLGFQHDDGVPYIQRDVAAQLSQKFDQVKKLYDDKKSDEYWEVNPVTANEHGLFSTTYDPVSVTRYMRTPQGTKKDNFNVVLQGNAFNNYDVAIQTDTGIRNLHQYAPHLGIISYQPNAAAIRSAYSKDHPLK